MTTGYSGTYAFNNTDFTLPPSSGRWVVRTDYGVDGGGHPIYASRRKFELSWDYADTDSIAQITNFYNLVGNTGTIVACLPDYGNTGFIFRNYSGCTLQEPELGEYFMGYAPLKLTILNVTTN